ncbi:hypothetical protein EV177_002527, partial [Coemansia sp. RSA 1804]
TPRRSAQFSDNDASTPKESAEASQERDPTATKSIDRSLQYQQQQTGRVASLAMSGNLGSLGVSDYDSGTGRNDTDELDAIWDELDNMELDSQTMRQLTETEEQFYATQQFVESMDLALSQEFTDPKHDASVNGRSVIRCTSADGRSAHGQRVVPPGPSTRSVPVTPSSGNPVYISDSDSPGNSTVEKSLSHGQSVTNASKEYVGSLDYTQDKQQQSGRHGKPTAWMSPLTSTSTSSRGKVNLYNRLAQHIPPRPDNDLVTSNRLPPTMQNHMIHKAQEPPESPSNHIHVDNSHFAEEIGRLRAENERMRAETDKLKAQLYTKDGEVRIVRDNLSRTEINYTQLQEQLANQKSRSEIDHKLVEGKLQNEIDRLKTELFFQQQEAQVTAISVVGSGGATQTPQLDEFCAAWLHDPTACKTDIHISDPLSNGAADNAVSSSLGNHRISQLSAVLNSALRSAIRSAPGLQLKNTNCIDFAMAVSLQCKLITRVIAMRPEAALSDKVWSMFDPCLETDPLLKHCEDLDALVGVLELVTILVQVSPESWRFIRDAPASFERFLLAAIRHLQHAPVDNDDLVLDGERSLLVLIASAIVTHEEDTPMLVNGMKILASTLVQWFIDKHRSLTSKHRNRKQDSPRRLQVFFEYTKCLNVVLSEVDDVAELLGGDNSPLFFAFVTTCTRMSIGESAFVDISSMRELATDLLAYVITEEQAISIQGLIA